MTISSPNPMFDHLLESSHRDNSNKWSNIGYGEETTQVVWIEFNFTNLIWSYAYVQQIVFTDEITFCFFLICCSSETLLGASEISCFLTTMEHLLLRNNFSIFHNIPI